MIDVALWGTGNMGRAAARAVLAHPELRLAEVIVRSPAKVGRDAGDVLDLGVELGVACTDDHAVVGSVGAVAYMASGDVRPRSVATDISACLRAGASVVSPSLYALYDPLSAPPELVVPLRDAAADGGSSLFVSGVDPGWANDLLPVLASGLCASVTSVRCQELFDYSTYDQPDAVRTLVGMGLPMDQVPPMVLPGVPTMFWGPSVRMTARGLGWEVTEIRETLERRPLAATVSNRLGTFDAGTQGALRFEVQGIVDGEPAIVVEHVTRIDPECAPDWPQPASGAGSHRVILEGSPRLEITVEAEEEDGNRAAGGNATAAARLVRAIPWLCAAPTGIYDALDVPLTPLGGPRWGTR